jgi:hypothetical protein
MCQSCQALRINGVLCHEIGCPDAWKDYSRECKNCGCNFRPEESDQQFCDEGCAASYWGLDANEEDSLDYQCGCCECGETGRDLDENGLCEHCAWEWPEQGSIEEASEYVD